MIRINLESDFDDLLKNRSGCSNVHIALLGFEIVFTVVAIVFCALYRVTTFCPAAGVYLTAYWNEPVFGSFGRPPRLPLPQNAPSHPDKHPSLPQNPQIPLIT